MKRINVDKDEKMNVKIELLKKCTLLCREARFQVKMLKNTLCSQHFWKLSCWKSARCCGAKHIFKSNCSKNFHARSPFGSGAVEKMHAVVVWSTFSSQNVQTYVTLGALLEVERLKKCTPLWREAHFQVKMLKKRYSLSAFGSWAVEKVHAVVARSTFSSQNAENYLMLGALLEVELLKKCRRCGAKHIFKSKCVSHAGGTFGSWAVEKVLSLWRDAFSSQNARKYLMLGALLEVELLKKCAPLWREARSQLKSLKNWGSRTTFGGSDVEKVHAVVARSTFRSQNG